MVVIFFQIWPEKTDPQKFVYEDVAIAAYLLVCILNASALYICGAQTGLITSGQIAHLVLHLTKDPGGLDANPDLVHCIFLLSVTKIHP